jgi:hypothetical protein
MLKQTIDEQTKQKNFEFWEHHFHVENSKTNVSTLRKFPLVGPLCK